MLLLLLSLSLLLVVVVVVVVAVVVVVVVVVVALPLVLIPRTFSEPFLERCVAVRPLRRAPNICIGPVENIAHLTFTLTALHKNCVNIFVVFAWGFGIEKWPGFLVNFSWSPFPGKKSTNNPGNFRGKFGGKFGENPGRKFKKFGELSFCNFSDLTYVTNLRKPSWARAPTKNH